MKFKLNIKISFNIMESLLLGVLAYGGYELSKEEKKKNIKLSKHKKKIKPRLTYHSDCAKTVERVTKNKAKKIKKTSQPGYLSQFEPMSIGSNNPIEFNQTDGIDINLQRLCQNNLILTLYSPTVY